MSTWQFSKKSGENETNPVQDEFFNDPEKLSVSGPLVRESIQNSMDARLDDSKPIVVKFSLGTQTDRQVIDKYFGGLRDHIDAVDTVRNEKLSNLCRYAVVEDFNTSGLLGDSTTSTVPAGEDKADYSYTLFWNNSGEGSKDTGSKGKWGIGKVVFPMTSEINTFFALTNRAPGSACGREVVLAGQCILKYHHLAGERFRPQGWWGDSSREKGVLHAPAPERDHDDFKADWKLSRETETGLSIVVPFVSSHMKLADLIEVVIREYFFSVLQGNLECHFRDLDSDAEALILNSENLSDVIEDHSLKIELSRDLSKEQIKAAVSTSRLLLSGEIVVPIIFGKPPGRQADFSFDDDFLAQVTESLDNNDKLLLEVTLPVPPRSGYKDSTLDTFRLAATKLEFETPDALFIREGLLVRGPRARKVRNFSAVTSIEPGPLGDLLGSMENPSHGSWSSKTEGCQKNYYGSLEAANDVLFTINNLPEALFRAIRDKPKEADDQLFANWLPEQEERSAKPNPEARPEGRLLPQEINIPQAVPEIQISQVSGGFSLQSKTALLGQEYIVSFAYAVVRGDPFSKWSEYDFVLGKGVNVSAKSGVRVTHESDNALRFSRKKETWGLYVTGFDPMRDLAIRVSRVEENQK